MPKERIYSVNASPDVCDVSVSWEKADDRPGVHTHDGDSFEGYVNLALVTRTESGHDGEGVVGYARLDRTGVNLLIRNAKRARNAAFGADE